MGSERTLTRFAGAWFGLAVAVYPIVGVTPLEVLSSTPLSVIELFAQVFPVWVVLYLLLLAPPLVVALPVAVSYVRRGHSVNRLVAFVVVAFLAVQFVVFLGGVLLALAVRPRRADWYVELHLYARIVLFALSYVGAYLVVFRLDALPLDPAA